jgi:hypothetical protein
MPNMLDDNTPIRPWDGTLIHRGRDYHFQREMRRVTHGRAWRNLEDMLEKDDSEL